MAKPDICKLIAELEAGESVDPTRVYHAFYYHNEGWQIIGEEDREVFSGYLKELQQAKQDKVDGESARRLGITLETYQAMARRGLY